MPAPAEPFFSVEALEDANTTFRDLLDSGSSNGNVKIRNDADELLSTVPMTDPCGTVSGVSGQLTITYSGQDPSADLGGIATYAELCDSDDNVHLTLPVIAGNVSTSNRAVLNSVTIILGAPVSVLTTVIG